MKRALPPKKFIAWLALVVTINAVVLYFGFGWRPNGTRPDPAKISSEVSTSVIESVPPAKSEIPLELSPRHLPPPSLPQRMTPPPWDESQTMPLPGAVGGKLSKGLRSGIIVDLSSRRVLWKKNAHKPVPVASLTKLMSALVIMEEMENSPSRIKWNSVIRVTKAATSVERSGVLGMKNGEFYTFDELMSAMMINSHNDAASQLAEFISGSVPAFVEKMNRRAKELKFDSAEFNSPNGLPQGKKRRNALCSVYDITRLCELLMEYPQVMELCITPSKKLHTGRIVRSHNNLLRRRPVPGLIGFKTGFTNRAGFCLAFGVTRNGRTIIGCVTGFPSAGERDLFCRKIIEWAFRTKPGSTK